MKIVKQIFLIALTFSVVAASAQSNNPYKSIGKKGETLSLTKGEYEEFFDRDSIQQIGTALVNIRTMKVVRFLKEEEIKERQQNEKQSRFLSVDPISAQYPMLTPYQFASNNPISGIDQDGLEYIHFTVILNKDGSFFKKVIAKDFRNRSEAEMNKMHGTKDFYKTYSAGFGPEGRGVKYTYFRMNDEGKLIPEPAEKTWEVRQDGGDMLSRHGLYYGEGSITTKGPLFEHEQAPGKGYYDFGYKPIDMGDALGRSHDKEEDNTSFKGWQNPQNILADIRFVKGLEKFLELAKDENYKDPFTGRRPSEEGLSSIRNAIKLFTAEIGRKKLQIDLQFGSGKMSADLHMRISKLITQAESTDVALPEPNKTDK